MYNCEVCGKSVGPGVPLKKHTIYRQRADGCQEIHQEVSVCEECQTLASFTPVAILMRQRGMVIKLVAPPPPVETVAPVKSVEPLKPGEAAKRLVKNPRLVYRK